MNLISVGHKAMQTLDSPHIEIEVKFYISDMGDMRKRITGLGAVSKGRHFEKNIRFDDPGGSLYQGRCLLRARKDRESFLTFKAPPDTEDADVKVMTEYEIKVSDFDTACKIIEAMGYFPVQQYEKWRETFVADGIHILIDTMPYGNFLEIEGGKEQIMALAGKLSLNWKNRILLNYLTMFEIIKKKMDLPFGDVTFDNFAPYPVDIEKFLGHFYARSTGGDGRKATLP